MTGRQRILKWFYPVIMKLSSLGGARDKVLKGKDIAPPVDFYSLRSQLGNGTGFDFSQLKGKKVLLVNTASDCGYTAQYESLQALQERFPNELVVLGFPANDFKEQEKGSDEEIATFCKVNFGVSFPLMKKSVVVNGGQQNPVFAWLSDPAQNGWNQQAPTWNFSKYLVNEQGRLLGYFDPGVSPLDDQIVQLITAH
nr:glutathione peroxidase [Flavihumibacter rivuli]